MKQKKSILFLSRLYYPHVGGVEKQVRELSLRLVKRGFNVTIVTEKYSSDLKDIEIVDDVKIVRFAPLKIKYLGLVSIWLWLFRNRELIKNTDIVHAHSVYIWYWPFRFLFPNKPSFVTFHGWEGIYPIPLKNKLIRKVDAFLSSKNITISDYVEKHYGIKADKLMYTSVDLPKQEINDKQSKSSKTLLYVGRLDEDTGLRKILEALKYLKQLKLKIEFCGDGMLRSECEKYGTVHGFTDPRPYYENAFICLSPGHTSILEAFTYKCLIATTYNNAVKKDYLLMTPFRDWIIVKDSPKDLAKEIKSYIKNPNNAKIKIEKAFEWVKTQNWESAVNSYLDIWGYV